MKRKRNYKETSVRLSSCVAVAIVAFLAHIMLISCSSCIKGDVDSTKTGKGESNASLPLNVTVFLDLSDRLTRELTPNQMERDIAIIKYVGNFFINESTKDGQLLQAKNNFQILFFPTPSSSEINTYAEKLKINLSDLKPEEKKKALNGFKNSLEPTTKAIYDEVLKSENWTGCDVWRFFSDKKVDQLCIKKDYRNILIILTDGYLFEMNDKIKEGNAYSYILPQTLQVPESSLIVRRTGLEDLEVLMLEVNPYDVKDKNKMVNVLETWFSGMGVSKFVVAETDLPENVKVIISNFLTSED